MYDSRRRIGRFAQMIRTRTDMHTKLVVLDAYIGLVLGLVLGLVPLTKRLEQPEQFLVTSHLHYRPVSYTHLTLPTKRIV